MERNLENCILFAGMTNKEIDTLLKGFYFLATTELTMANTFHKNNFKKRQFAYRYNAFICFQIYKK